MKKLSHVILLLCSVCLMLSSCSESSSLANFSKRKYLKKAPKQKAVKEKKTIEYNYNEIPELYATTELTIEEYLVENYSEVYEKSITNQEAFSIKNLQFNAYKKKVPSNVYHSNKVSIKSKNRPTESKNEPKDFLTLFLVLGIAGLITYLLFGWENRLENRKNRVSKKKCVLNNCNNSRLFHDQWGPIKLFQRNYKFCQQHFNDYHQNKSFESENKRKQEYQKREEKRRERQSMSMEERERKMKRKRFWNKFVSILKIIAVLVFLALGLAITLGFIGGAVYVLFIAPATDGMYWAALFLLAGAAGTVMGVGKIYEDNDYGGILEGSQ